MDAIRNELPHLQARVTPGRGTGLQRGRRADVTMWPLEKPVAFKVREQRSYVTAAKREGGPCAGGGGTAGPK